MAVKIWANASTQKANVGVAGYGTEEDNMFLLRDEFIKQCNKMGYKFDFGKNASKDTSLTDCIKQSNKFGPDIHIEFHTNGTGRKNSKVRGCEVFYSKFNKNGLGKKYANILFNEVAKVTPTEDRGVFSDGVLYTNGLQSLRETNSVAILCEYIYHDNVDDVKFFKAHLVDFAVATATAVYKMFNITPIREKEIYYCVQSGAYLDKQNALDLIKRLKFKGFEGIIIEKKI